MKRVVALNRKNKRVCEWLRNVITSLQFTSQLGFILLSYLYTYICILHMTNIYAVGNIIKRESNTAYSSEDQLGHQTCLYEFIKN